MNIKMIMEFKINTVNIIILNKKENMIKNTYKIWLKYNGLV